ncbi:MAG: GNAT family N-acetyltransferase [Chloroflexi bacterium]|nr:GNAT family N-acetyltransferase [Chloroflexota bacterium]
MDYIIRPLVKADEPFLWEMLYYAAHMEEDGETSLQAAKNNPDLIKYVKDWGRETDMGFIALEPHSPQPIGAAWVRLLIGKDKTFIYVNDFTPELAIAVLPDYSGKGVGTLLLSHLLEAAKEAYPAVVLSVRSTNPARHLYERLGFVITGKATNRVGTESYNMLLQF